MSGARPERKANRLHNFDYRASGFYFVTICVQDYKHRFGTITRGEMVLNRCGRAAVDCWLAIPHHFPHISLDEFVVMPNHIHGILVIDNRVGNKNFCSLPDAVWQQRWARSLSSAVRGFKIGVSKWCRARGYAKFRWQKSFYDHIIRDERSLGLIRSYIHDNPLRWGGEGDENSANTGLGRSSA